MEKIILPYLNVLEVDEINRANATKVIAIDKDNEIKTLTIDDYTATDYNGLIGKPQINGVELKGNLTSEQLDIPSNTDLDNEVNNLIKKIDLKQDKLTSGQNIKTVNNLSLLGSGNIEVGNDIPTLFLPEDYSAPVGDYDAVVNAVQNHTPYFISSPLFSNFLTVKYNNKTNQLESDNTHLRWNLENYEYYGDGDSITISKDKWSRTTPMSPDYLVQANTLSTINDDKLTIGQNFHLPNVVIVDSKNVLKGYISLRQWTSGLIVIYRVNVSIALVSSKVVRKGGGVTATMFDWEDGVGLVMYTVQISSNNTVNVTKTTIINASNN